MKSRNFILATAGHVDHGKSSLVKALTGVDPDRLPEEKARGITIDLGFAHLELEGKSGGEPVRFHVGIVDVPGHEDFVKNMVAGVGSIDLALLIVAADDGWMPQTEEHLQILEYLGVTRAVVALTKIDLAADENAVIEQVRAKLANSALASAAIVPTSVVSGRGLAELKLALVDALEQIEPPRDIGKPRLPVDRVFTLGGIGRVVTGTLTGGELRRGQEIAVQPGGRRSRIRSVQNHNREVEMVGPGTRAALNLPDVKGAGGSARIERGDVVALPGLGEERQEMDALLVKSARLRGVKNPAARPLKDGTRVRVHLGSSDVPAHVILLGERTLEAGGRALAHLRFESPVFAFAGDRFIVRDWSEQATLAGGIVLDPDPPSEKLQGESRRRFLQARAEAPADARSFVLTQVQRFRTEPTNGLLAKSRFSAEEISKALNQLVAEGRAGIAGTWAIDAAWWKELRDAAAKRIESEHCTHPNRPGLALAELKGAVEKELPAPELFEVLVNDLCGQGYVRTGVAIKSSTHRLALPPELQAAGDRVRRALAAKRLDPPSRKEIPAVAAAQQAVRFLLETGEAMLVAEEVVLLVEAFTEAREVVKRYLEKNGSATASELRQALGTSRRVLIPLLEQLDKEGVTRREGDRRVLR